MIRSSQYSRVIASGLMALLVIFATSLAVAAAEATASALYAVRPLNEVAVQGFAPVTEQGMASDDDFGIATAAAGDVNGDGFPDVVVGSYDTVGAGVATGALRHDLDRANGYDVEFRDYDWHLNEKN